MRVHRCLEHRRARKSEIALRALGLAALACLFRSLQRPHLPRWELPQPRHKRKLRYKHKHKHRLFHRRPLRLLLCCRISPFRGPLALHGRALCLCSQRWVRPQLTAPSCTRANTQSRQLRRLQHQPQHRTAVQRAISSAVRWPRSHTRSSIHFRATRCLRLPNRQRFSLMCGASCSNRAE